MSAVLPEMDDDQAREVLEGILSDPCADPVKLTYGLLKSVTGNFSDENEIGRGGFGVVYKGCLQNGVVAVKKIINAHEFSDKIFMDEIKCLIKAKHKNIVRFLGYCSDTQGELMKHEGAYVMAEVHKRLLCFEFVPNGNIHQFLEDNRDRSDWHMSYRIIKGICEGLKYLHEERISHLDLKPENVMLDACMEPKITDFGLSRHLVEGQSKIYTQIIRGTRGYIAPESIDKGEISLKSDIYALGIIIIKLLIGSNIIDFDNWHESSGVDNPQVKSCIEAITRKCIEFDQDKRPTICEIMRELDEIEIMVQELTDDIGSSTYKVSRMAFPGTELLDVHPLELRFPFQPNHEQESQCQLSLINKTDAEVGFFVLPDFGVGSLHGILMPMSTSVFTLTMLISKEDCQPSEDSSGDVPILMFTMRSNDDTRHLMKTLVDEDGELSVPTDDLCKQVHGLGGEIHQTMLKVVVVASEHDTRTPKFLDAKYDMDPREEMIFPGFRHTKKSTEVHPTKPWISVVTGTNIFIWNWQTNEEVRINKSADFGTPTGVRFIARNQWLVAEFVDRDAKCRTVVFTCPTLNQVHKYSESQSGDHTRRGGDHGHRFILKVHPTRPCVLSIGPSNDRLQLLDYDKYWFPNRVFDHSGQVEVLFNPKNANSFVTREGNYYKDNNTLKIWKLDCSKPIATLKGFEGTMIENVFTYGGDQHLIAAISGPNAEIWDLKKGMHVHTLSASLGSEDKIAAVACHPRRPVLVTASNHGYIHVWDCKTYRLKKEYVNLGRSPTNIAFLDSTRLMIAYERRIEIMDLDLK